MSGATTAPMLVPELKRPVANARSFTGNHSATDLDRGRKVARFADAEREPRRDESRDRRRIDQAEHAEQRRDAGPYAPLRRAPSPRCSTPAPRSQIQSRVPTRSMNRPGQQQADRIRELETEDDVGVVDLAPAVLLLQRRLEEADHLAIDVVDRRGQEEQPADHPAIPSDAAPGRQHRRRIAGVCACALLAVGAAIAWLAVRCRCRFCAVDG